ncbi:hypothetical protein HK104_004880 [Borealophlyctis nickersoniae]|nr:hypothetical protein HK104_004880 [Borealophlyctis nickersoniae]
MVPRPRSRLLYLLAGCAVCLCGSLVFFLPYALLEVDVSLAETATERIALSAYVIDMMFTYGAGYMYGLILLDRFALFHNLLHYPRYLIPFLFCILSMIYPIGFLSDIIVIWHMELSIEFNVLSLSAYLYVILLDMVMAPVMVRKVVQIVRELEGMSATGVMERGEQQEWTDSKQQEGGTMSASSRILCSAGTAGGEKVSLSVDVGWRFIALFVGAMVFDVLSFGLYGLMTVFPDDTKALWQLMGTCMALQ